MVLSPYQLGQYVERLTALGKTIGGADAGRLQARASWLHEYKTLLTEFTQWSRAFIGDDIFHTNDRRAFSIFRGQHRAYEESIEELFTFLLQEAEPRLTQLLQTNGVPGPMALDEVALLRESLYLDRIRQLGKNRYEHARVWKILLDYMDDQWGKWRFDERQRTVIWREAAYEKQYVLLEQRLLSLDRDYQVISGRARRHSYWTQTEER